MQIVIIATRKDLISGELYRTYHQIPYRGAQYGEDVPGWNGKNAGLCPVDFANILGELETTACNIHSLTIDIVQTT